MLSLCVPKRYISGTSLSDFSIPVLDEQAKEVPSEDTIVNRQYATPRGRKVKKRQSKDLLVLWKQAGQINDFCSVLIDRGVAERLLT